LAIRTAAAPALQAQMARNQYQGLMDDGVSGDMLCTRPDQRATSYHSLPTHGGHMSSTQTSHEQTSQIGTAATVDLKLEVVVIPVSDVDRAKRFYGSLGWRLDADFPFDNGVRVVQFTPPGSGCSIQFGTNITSAAPGSAQSLYLIVSEIEAARDELVARGADVSQVFHPEAPGAQFQPEGSSGRVSGPAPEHASYRSFATFSDPGGNSWLLQEIKTRLPGRGFSSLDIATLTELLREAEQGHGKYEPTAPKHHWSGWYAAYIVAAPTGEDSRGAANDGARHMEVARQ
jgi:catechol 2,3-dioxygenase-like lactoylglutathione lyase family enzyme